MDHPPTPTIPPIPFDIETILIVLPSWVGDAAMATPVLRAMREQRSGSRIVGIMRPGIDQLLDGLDSLDERRVVGGRGLVNLVRASAAMRQSRAQAGLLLPNSFRTAFALRLSSVPRRIGYARDGRGWTLTRALKPPPRQTPVPAVDYYAALGEFALGGKIHDRQLQLAVTEEQEGAAAALMPDGEQPFIVLNPGANDGRKRWPASRFAAVGDALAQRHDLHVLVNGGSAEIELATTVIEQSTAPERYTNLPARGITLGTLKAVLRRARLLITNDTGPRHVAAAFGTPAVCLFGPTDHRWTTLPGAKECILLAEPFLPEELVADQHAAACAIDRIPTGDVVVAAESLLTGNGA